MSFSGQKTCGLHTQSQYILCLTKRRVHPGRQYKRHASNHISFLLCFVLSHAVFDCDMSSQQIQASGETIGLHHFKPIKPLGSGDTGRYHFNCVHNSKLEVKTVVIYSKFVYTYIIYSLFWLQSVHLVELKGTGELYAMKAMEKTMMLNRNKVYDGE